MKKYIRSFLLFALLGVCMLTNSCKKDKQSTIQHLLTTGVWQLATLQVNHYKGDSKISTDTLNTACDTTQIFTFNDDNTCTYTNFDCLPQPTAHGTWQLSSTKLYLNSDIVCQDTTAAGSSTPFANAQIVNLGDFSLVLQTGDIENYYSSTQPRTITRYGFIRQKTVNN
ncbi:DUF5004 domain-containing protein [Mucilaginibacter segetis]|uniref:Lipocalin-like domain-containing protein n=1 Tax=Mucilaginibacter segetis TaxID=2793071 RepID=A0A934PWW2_9SPHI|nr:lipocalin family protein [Mucilaginibacter segetis]MBK0380576.1 hypothetical protein [Mucilaginibacter segetis]